MDCPALNPHEAIELREFLNQQMVGVKKISASMHMVRDEELRNFMQDSINSTKYSLNEISCAIRPQLNM